MLGAHQLAFTRKAPDSRYHALSVNWGAYAIDFIGCSLNQEGWDYVVQHRKQGVLGRESDPMFDQAREHALALVPAGPPRYAHVRMAAD